VKERINILFILSVILFSINSESLSATYYVSYSTGNDLKDGLSPKTAWKYCPNMRLSANNFFRNTGTGHTIIKGDTIYFKRGDIWDGVYLHVYSDLGGITFSSRSDFAIPGHESTLPQIRPWVLNNSGWTLESGSIYSKYIGSTIRQVGVWYNGIPLQWVESNAPGSNKWYWNQSQGQIYVNIGDNPNGKDIRIAPWVAAVDLWGNDWIVEYLDLSRGAFGLQISKTKGVVNNCIVRYNKLHDTEYNYKTGSDQRNYSQGFFSNRLNNFQFIGNEMYNISLTVPGDGRAHGCYIGYNVHNAIIAYNYAHDCNAGAGIQTYSDSPAAPESVNVKIYGNLIASCDVGIFYWDCTGCILANNTIINSFKGGISTNNTPDSSIVNNIFSNPKATNTNNNYPYDISWRASTGLSIPDYNYYYRASNAEYILRMEGNPVKYYRITDWATYRTAYPTWDAHSIASTNSPFNRTPNFINSLAGGKGQDISSVLGSNMMLDPQTTWPLEVKIVKQRSGAWDIGAYSAISSSSISSP